MLKLHAAALAAVACLTAACAVEGEDGFSSFSSGAIPDEDTGDEGDGEGDGDGDAADTGDGDGDGEGDTSGDGDGDTTDAGDGDGDGDGDVPDIGECSNFVSVDQFATFINTERQKYAGQLGALPHSRYKGMPWKGEGHENYTFLTPFQIDAGIAAQAQAQAEALAAGGSPQGSSVSSGNGLCPTTKPFYIHGINTTDWTITTYEDPGDFMKPNGSCPEPFALLPSNGSARMGLFYHDFGGDGPAISRMGVGAAMDEDCRVWWVLRFGA
jgi:hypothetical protein